MLQPLNHTTPANEANKEFKRMGGEAMTVDRAHSEIMGLQMKDHHTNTDRHLLRLLRGRVRQEAN